ncbi:hypothetical protein SAMN06265222_12232 [Neorhodopirellula lusitana]|uniref:Transmembrane protein n=1 Tax=Neorhodopirellula lusitana TaxID=445327 RepID=A0ABY1QPT6_9BACT|nr:hypothetical protein [Neorhodopirellula lusitana]SMP76883.1 hypothetical protein SAMN06265222_12232 [Neorhodopirellula lusitana]
MKAIHFFLAATLTTGTLVGTSAITTADDKTQVESVSESVAADGLVIDGPITDGPTTDGPIDDKSVDAKAVAEPATVKRTADAITSDKQSSSARSAKLSVAPLDHVEYPDDRPHWIDSPDGRKSGKPSGLHVGKAENADALSIAVVSPPQASPKEAAEMMEVMARGAVENYIDQHAATLNERINSKEITVEMDWIRDELIVRRYDGEVQSGDATLYESACLLQITPPHQEVLNRLIDNHRLLRRLAIVGIFALIGFGGLVGGSIVLGGLASHQERRKVAS